MIYTLPESKHTKLNLQKMDDEQIELFQIISKKFIGCCKN